MYSTLHCWSRTDRQPEDSVMNLNLSLSPKEGLISAQTKGSLTNRLSNTELDMMWMTRESTKDSSM